jgi:hypothetical protein
MTAARAAMLTVFDGRELRGFLLQRGKRGVEAFDREERSLGVFKTEADAANAVTDIAAGDSK